MNHPMIAAALIVIIALITTAGDYCLKLASIDGNSRIRWFLLGCAIYGLTAFGWVYAMRHLKLATLGVIFSVSMVLFMAMLGTLVFKEELTRYEVIGIILGIASITLLFRHAS